METATIDFQSKYEQVNGVKIHYVIGGKGPVILLIHGWPYTWLEWKELMPLLARAGYTVIAPDLRGCGESDKPAAKYTKREVAEDLAQLIDKLGFQQIYLLGIDIGMMVAYSLAANYPAKVRKVILGEGVLPGFGLEKLMDVSQGGSWHFGFQMQAEFAAQVIAGNEETYFSSFWQIMSPVKGINEAYVKKYLIHYGTIAGAKGGFYHYATLLEDATYNQQNPGKILKMPVLVLNGDKGIPQAATINSVAQVSNNYETALVENCGHTLGEENPEETAQLVLNFIRK